MSETSPAVELPEQTLWGHATRGLFGVMRILETYEQNQMNKAPTKDFVRCAMRLRDLAQKLEDKGHADNRFSFDNPRHT